MDRGSDENFWVFAYGSLIWRPDFPFVEGVPGRLHGWHRRMCIRSIHYRGRPDRPGLVLGLDRGGSCRGLAYRVADDLVETVRRILDERELISGVYDPRYAPVTLDDGRRVAGYLFVARRGHDQYAGGLSTEETAAMIRQGHGSCGSSRDYLANTVRHLEILGLGGASLRRLLQLVDEPVAVPS